MSAEEAGVLKAEGEVADLLRKVFDGFKAFVDAVPDDVLEKHAHFIESVTDDIERLNTIIEARAALPDVEPGGPDIFTTANGHQHLSIMNALYTAVGPSFKITKWQPLPAAPSIPEGE